MSYTITVDHTFEAGHRLPHLPGKCQSLHGHSWSVAVSVTAPDVDYATQTVAHFGDLKKALRTWVDLNLDHGLMLGRNDPLTPLLALHGKVFTFDPSDGRMHGAGGHWPSVENVAELIARVMEFALSTEIEHATGAFVSRVTVSETAVNAATWEA